MLIHQTLEVVFRTVLSTFLLIVVTKLFGKFASRNVTYLGFMVHVMIGSIAANLAFNLKIDIRFFMLAFAAFTFIILILNKLAMHSKSVRKWILGESSIIIKDGKILEENISKAGFSLEALTQELRFRDAFDVSEVEYAVIEPNGHLSILKKPEYRGVVKSDLAIPSSPSSKLPVELIMDGEILFDNLIDNSISEDWLSRELERRQLELKDIDYAIISTNGELYFDLFKDN